MQIVTFVLSVLVTRDPWQIGLCRWLSFLMCCLGIAVILKAISSLENESNVTQFIDTNIAIRGKQNGLRFNPCGLSDWHIPRSQEPHILISASPLILISFRIISIIPQGKFKVHSAVNFERHTTWRTDMQARCWSASSSHGSTTFFGAIIQFFSLIICDILTVEFNS